ncbi:hypothetical protein J6590_033139 [Homalodisca vitripennis]|nr:hypothetical protein J6590_033139 [Homalodisca vitripennis]
MSKHLEKKPGHAPITSKATILMFTRGATNKATQSSIWAIAAVRRLFYVDGYTTRYSLDLNRWRVLLPYTDQ